MICCRLNCLAEAHLLQQHHVIKLVSQSVKRAKTFETQRIVKKLKSSKAKAKEEEEEGGADLEKELEVTKAVEAQAVALQALWTKLGKARLLPRGAASEGFLPAFLLLSSSVEAGRLAFFRLSTRRDEEKSLIDERALGLGTVSTARTWVS